MITLRYWSLLLLVAQLSSFAQECLDGRYRTSLFNDVTTTLAVPYGSNEAVAGGTQTLFMDVYEPAGDVLSQRPVVLVSFGGSFVSGTRADVAAVCVEFARRGYVAVSPDYRVGFFLPNATTTTLAVLRGAHDLKACVRFLRRSVVENDNPYGIDPERIIIGGFSAGAISALHAGFLDEEDEWPAVLASQYASLGGLEGNSGSPGYSSDVFAIYSYSGALGDTLWIQPDDTPVCSVHEIGDQVVPYYTQEVSVLGFPTGLVASGSHDLHLRADHVGVDNCLLTYPGNDHVGYVNTDPVGSLGFVIDFCAELVCGGEATCGNVMASVPDGSSLPTLSVHPNPTAGLVQVDARTAATILVMDMTGREVLRVARVQGSVTVDLSALPDGVYLLRSTDPGSPSIRLVRAG